MIIAYFGFIIDGMDRGLKICTIGGGSGMPVVNKGLVSAGFKNIKSVVTTFDSGGDTGRIRTDERGKVLAFSDYWRSLVSLWPDGKQKKIWQEILMFRDGRGRNFGNLFFQFMAEKTKNLSKVDEMFADLVLAKLAGKVVPVSLQSSQICFRTLSGKKYNGEHNLDEMRMSSDRVASMWLKPKVVANNEAINALKMSDVIVVCPGSIYGSVLVNFLPKGMAEAFLESKAKKILIANIMMSANEGIGFDQDEYVAMFSRYLGKKADFDLIIMADLSVFDKKILKVVIKNYEMEHADLLVYQKQTKMKIVLADVAVVEKQNMRLRHDEKKLAKFFEDFEIA